MNTDHETEDARLAREQQADDFERAVEETEAAEGLVGVWAAGDVWFVRASALRPSHP